MILLVNLKRFILLLLGLKVTIDINEQIDIPERVAVCPECGSKLYVEINEWESETGIPTYAGIYIYCQKEESQFIDDLIMFGKNYSSHCHWQSYWQNTIDKVRKWGQDKIRIRRD